MKLDVTHELIVEFIERTQRPIFLTGKAGTGKTTFLRYLKSTTAKNLAVVAPTAVAAINAGGVTIHSFFQMPFGPVLPNTDSSLFTEFSGKSFGTEKAKLIKCLELLIIDEISMVRADTIDYIDRALRFVKGNNSPFGGIQLLMIGDLFQLPPVYQNDWHLLAKFYSGPYFFDSLVFRRYQLLTFELETVYRQSDPTFIEILNQIRNGSISEQLLTKLNEHYTPNSENQDLANYVTLTTHNPLVKKINEERLKQLPGESYIFKAKVTGDFPKEAFPADEELVLKPGAMVMFIKNDSSGKKQFYNGRTAKVESINGDNIKVTFIDDGSAFEATHELWENTKYALSETDQKVNQTSSGSFSQYPFRLAWAITIHKSQGLTFDRAVVDVGAAFAHGQTYVALSRCRNLEGLLLKEKVTAKNIITDSSVTNFMKQAQLSPPNQATLTQIVSSMEMETLTESFDLKPLMDTWQHFSITIKEILPGQFSILEKLEANEQVLATKIYTVAQRFIQKELNDETQQPSLHSIKERLTKAAGYFSPLLITLHETVLELHRSAEDTPFHTDYFPTLNQLLEQLETKIEVFKLLPNIQSAEEIKKIAKTKAIAYKPIDSWKQREKAAVTIQNPQLYAELDKWRAKVAGLRKTLDYLIISDQTMADISAKTPRNHTLLAKIKNVGEGKTAEYGDEILKIVRQHLGENDLFS